MKNLTKIVEFSKLRNMLGSDWNSIQLEFLNQLKDSFGIDIEEITTKGDYDFMTNMFTKLSDFVNTYSDIVFETKDVVHFKFTNILSNMVDDIITKAGIQIEDKKSKFNELLQTDTVKKLENLIISKLK